MFDAHGEPRHSREGTQQVFTVVCPALSRVKVHEHHYGALAVEDSLLQLLLFVPPEDLVEDGVHNDRLGALATVHRVDQGNNGSRGGNGDDLAHDPSQCRRAGLHRVKVGAPSCERRVRPLTNDEGLKDRARCSTKK